jgi:hypothetical protein
VVSIAIPGVGVAIAVGTILDPNASGIEKGIAILGIVPMVGAVAKLGSGAAQGGKAFTGIAYELKFIPRHLEGSAAAAKLLAKGEAAHVFNDMETLAAVENAIFENGTFTGTVSRGARSTERFGLWFENPIGSRIAPDGSRIPLFYGEAKVSPDGLYHVMPRTGPAR